LDFDQELARRVSAREAAYRAQQQQEAEAQTALELRASELSAHVTARFQAVADRYRELFLAPSPKKDRADQEIYELRRVSPPQGSLFIQADTKHARFRWTREHLKDRWNERHLLEVTPADVDQTILDFIDPDPTGSPSEDSAE
jgi:hypothetical protein